MPLIKSGRKNETDLAYAAGLFDGEGSISASLSPKCPKNVRVLVSIAMCDIAGVEHMINVFGGSLRTEKHRTKTGKPIYTWAVYCKNAAVVLAEMLPYLKVKKDKAVMAIELAAMMRSRQSAKYYQFTDEDIAARHDLVTRIRAANAATNGRIANASH